MSIRVLVVDDSALIRTMLTKGLSTDPDIEVVAAASDPYVARDMIVKHKPDVLTLDVEMPRMDGVAFLKRLMPHFPLPVVMVSSLTQKGKTITLQALEAGAVDFVSKPSVDLSRSFPEVIGEVIAKVKMASKVDVSRYKGRVSRSTVKTLEPTKALAESTDKVIAIGASTGGVEALSTVLAQFPSATPGIVVVQHMPPGFTKSFADRLNSFCAMEVKEAQSGDRVMSGRALIAAGDRHMEVKRSGGIYEVVCREGEKVSGHRPSVDVLMHSVAQHVGKNAVGAMLTGMGRDGAEGMLAMRQQGAPTMAQDEKSCVVFGMPKMAYENGGAQELVHLDQIAERILRVMPK